MTLPAISLIVRSAMSLKNQKRVRALVARVSNGVESRLIVTSTGSRWNYLSIALLAWSLRSGYSTPQSLAPTVYESD